MSTYVIASFDFEGLHNWPGVVNHPELADVDFLQYMHRHTFYVRMKKLVQHDDRDVEIILLKRLVRRFVLAKYAPKGTEVAHLGPMSCEMLARELCDNFGLSSCEVTEDNENGAEYVAE